MTKTLRTAAAATVACNGHVKDALVALADYREIGVNPAGILANPELQLAELRVALEAVAKAIAIIDTTAWPSPEDYHAL